MDHPIPRFSYDDDDADDSNDDFFYAMDKPEVSLTMNADLKPAG